MSFLLWRAIRYKLPTNESLANFGVELVKCYCCFQQGWDDVEHIFLQEHFAGHIWKFFASSMGLQLQQHSLHNQLLCWSGVTGKNTAHTMIIHILPIVICWNLWKNRCSAKYGGKISSIHKVKYLIIKDMILTINSVFPYFHLSVSWIELVACIEKCKHEIRVTLVMWKTPPRTKYKLNTNGSALHNPEKIGGGGILRDDQGNIVYAFVVPFGEGTNNQAEVQAASCYSPLEDTQCVHTYREANATADLLAKHSHQQDIVQNYYTHHQLPLPIKGSYLLEKFGVQNFRRKKLKRIKQPP
ncbi:hypothetical protein KY289_001213 [Solanum tuberosum]|nr:hypothetical protein KY289_001213 [Solanum tuberosum]